MGFSSGLLFQTSADDPAGFYSLCVFGGPRVYKTEQFGGLPICCGDFFCFVFLCDRKTERVLSEIG